MSEVRGLRWRELAGGTWELPAGRAKARRSILRPLSPEALEVLERQRRLELAGELVFPSPRTGRPLSPTALAHVVGGIAAELGGEPFTAHDLRRTAASGMTRLGFSRLVVGKVLGHADAGVTSIYDRHSYLPEMAAALEAWGDHVAGLLEPKARSAAASSGGSAPASGAAGELHSRRPAT